MPSDHAAPDSDGNHVAGESDVSGRHSRDGGDAEVAPTTLTFPDLPRLELDQLLGQLVERAHEVMATQGRLRGLLHANQLITTDLTLPVVLRRIAECARELVGARYAALGVISSAGGLAEFVHTGMPARTAEEIGHLPQGKGLLGALIEDPRPIRLVSIADDPRSSGFPPSHPPMSSFLGVPIRIRDEIFGNLYLAESTKGAFSPEDEELTSAIAATAAVAIDNARLYASARTRGEWLQASAAVNRQLLAAPAADTAHPLQLIAERSREIADADLVTVALPDGDLDQVDELHVEVAVGVDAGQLTGRRLPVGGSLEGQVFLTGEPLRLPQLDGETHLESVAPADLDVGPVLILPLVGSGRVHGVLSAARISGRTAFTADDLDMAGSFANQGAVAIELADARAEQQRAAMLDERDRIAADLHDHVIQRLFAAGLSLQYVATGLGPGPMTDRVLNTVADLDTTISQIRTTIFQLHDLSNPQRAGIRAQLLDIAADVGKALSFEPALRFTGSIDTLPADIAEDVVAVVREALTNISRHAHARGAEVDLTVRSGELTLSVHDDGIGMRPSSRSGGLANMRRRAERHGGTFDIAPREHGGTTVTWFIPIDQPLLSARPHDVLRTRALPQGPNGRQAGASGPIRIIQRRRTWGM